MRTLIRGLRRALTLSAVAGLLLAGTAVPSSARVVFTVERCGETVSGNMRLEEDLDCRDLANWFDEDAFGGYGGFDFRPYALRVKGTGTLDLNGYTIISGPIQDIETTSGGGFIYFGGDEYEYTTAGESFFYDSSDGGSDYYSQWTSIGVMVEESFNVTVKNGVIRGARGEVADDWNVEFGDGNQVLVYDSRDVVLEDLVVSENANIRGAGPSPAAADNAYDGSGVALVNAQRVTVRGVDSFRNDGNGMTIFASRDVRVSESSFNDNEDYGIWIAGGYDDFVDNDDFEWSGFRPSRNIDLTNVEVTNNEADGIRMVWNVGWWCNRDNTYDFCDDEDQAFDLPRNGGGTWTGLTVGQNDDDGIALSGVDGITIQDSYIVANDDDGVQLFLTEGVTVQRTTIEANGDEGIEVDWDAYSVLFSEWWDDEGLGAFAASGDDVAADVEVETAGEAGTSAASVAARIANHSRATDPFVAAKGLRILGNTIIDNDSTGIEFDDVAYATVAGNLIEGNGLVDEDEGMEVDDAYYLRITDNQFIGNENEGLEIDDSYGVLVLRNIARDNGEDGFSFDDMEELRLERNHSEGNGDDGFYIADVDYSIFVRNVAIDNDEDGFYIDGADYSLFDRNDARENGNNGFKIDDSTDNTTFRRNTSSNNADDGFNFADPERLSVISNRATLNARNGFWMENYNSSEPGFVVYRGNRADRNSDWGHVSSGDIVDNQRRFSTVRSNGGRGNGDGLCLNVRCGRRLVTGGYGG